MPDALTIRQEVYRKFIHLTSAFLAIILWYFGRDVLLPWLISAAVILPSLDYWRHNNTLLKRIYFSLFKIVTRPHEYKKITGASWVFMGAAFTAYIFNSNAAAIGMLVMSLADSAAALVGIPYGKTKLFKKSLEGSTAFFVTAFLIITSFSGLSIWINIAAASGGTLVELFANRKFNDNLWVPFTVALILSLGGLS